MHDALWWAAVIAGILFALFTLFALGVGGYFLVTMIQLYDFWVKKGRR